ncbi:SprT family protein [Lactobacillus psittaci]|uniref:Metallopeptidase n=1 Tax=Lactobacillus psittaci DSM 15354 TaxID=1122152 RepID=A0A0R1S0K3_9LACO|nr:SprT family protein [Lactobacillus psittaci]KRL62672.1 metallopeptidase [Lactobacillus psittaci DSM 15354]
MNEKELTQLVKAISLKYFDYPFDGQVIINYRFKTTGGRYHLNDHHIEINAHFLKKKYYQDLVGIIKHELCHYYLHVHHLGYRHRDQDFKYLLKKVGASRYAPDIGLRKKPKYLYCCHNCGQRYPRQRRLNTRRFLCGKCHGKLFLLKKDLH